MAAFAAVQGSGQYGYDLAYKGWDSNYVEPDAKPAAQQPSQADQRLHALYAGIDYAIRWGALR